MSFQNDIYVSTNAWTVNLGDIIEVHKKEIILYAYGVTPLCYHH